MKGHQGVLGCPGAFGQAPLEHRNSRGIKTYQHCASNIPCTAIASYTTNICQDDMGKTF